jgi:hypothetical protein
MNFSTKQNTKLTVWKHNLNWHIIYHVYNFDLLHGIVLVNGQDKVLKFGKYFILGTFKEGDRSLAT